jgi:hypothetical protein
MKRFTETTKWKDPWFRRLSSEHKLFWIYLLDEVDNAGVWMVDEELAGMIIGYQYPLDTLLNVFGDRIVVFDGGRKWWVRKFVEFQYGVLTYACRPHRKPIAILKKYNLWEEYRKGINTLEEEEEEEDQDKEEDKEEEEDKDLLHPSCASLFLERHPDYERLTRDPYMKRVTPEQYQAACRAYPRADECKAVDAALLDATMGKLDSGKYTPAQLLQWKFKDLDKMTPTESVVARRQAKKLDRDAQIQECVNKVWEMWQGGVPEEDAQGPLADLAFVMGDAAEKEAREILEFRKGNES